MPRHQANLGGTTIRTLWILTNGRLQFIFDTVPVLTATDTLALALTLNLDGRAFAFEDADSKGVDFRRWNNSGLSWTVGATVSATVTAAGTAAPVAPAAPTVAAVSGSTTSLTVSWSAPANNGSAITSYDLQYRQGTSGNFTDGPQNVNGTSATLTGLAANSPYQVQVRATNAEGDSDWSASGSGTTNAVQTATAPTAPTVAAGSGSSTSLAVSWSAPADNGSAITSYDLQYRQGTSGNFTDGPQNVNGTSATLTGLAANSPYQVQVRATNAEGDSDWSASGSGTTADPPGVTVSPSELTVAEGTTVPYTVRLNSRPTGTVTVTPSSDNPAVTFSPDILTLTFTPQTWATEQTVTVTAAQDTAEATATISHAVAGEGYGSVMAPSVSVRVTVPDERGMPCRRTIEGHLGRIPESIWGTAP